MGWPSNKDSSIDAAPIGDEKACDVVSMTRYVREHGLIVCVMGRLVCVRLGTRDEVDKM